MGNLVEKLSDYAALCVQGVDGIFREEIQNESQPSSAAQTFVDNVLESKWNDPQESALKKIMAAATYIAEAKGLPTTFDTKKPLDIAIAADEALDTVKSGYKIAKGVLTTTDYFGYKAKKIVARNETIAHETIDSVAVAVKQFANRAIDWLSNTGVERVIDKVSYVCPQVRYVKPFAVSFARSAAPYAKKAISCGVDLLAAGAKKVVDYVKEKAISLVTKTKDKVLSFFGIKS